MCMCESTQLKEWSRICFSAQSSDDFVKPVFFSPRFCVTEAQGGQTALVCLFLKSHLITQLSVRSQVAGIATLKMFSII